jgi:hypothetical protein
MNSERDRQESVCSELRRLGFASGRKLRLYGEVFEFTSDPVAEGGGYSLKGISRKSGRARSVHIPLSVVNTIEHEIGVIEEMSLAA